MTAIKISKWSLSFIAHFIEFKSVSKLYLHALLKDYFMA